LSPIVVPTAAYFFGEGGPRLLTYDTPKRAGVPREVVKERGEQPRAWFENEGIAYEVARLGSLWGVRVKALLHVHWAQCANAAARIRAHVKGNPANEI
jgi:hypothetical protein